MVHNRTLDDNYAQDVEEARRLLALYESLHNGKIRDERGEEWYGSEEMRAWNRVVVAEMGILLGRIIDYADAVRSERDRYLRIAYGLRDNAALGTAPDDAATELATQYRKAKAEREQSEWLSSPHEAFYAAEYIQVLETENARLRRRLATQQPRDDSTGIPF